jgi:glycosyltransferase involved in cell wall biosynthesis
MPDDDRPFLLLLGASYHHKNRAFALELLGRLRSRGWDGRLVLAGPTPPRGNSAGDEAVAALRSPTVAEHVVTLGDLTEQEKTWLYDRAALSLYPTNSEGFGLVPFESAHHRVPVLSTRQGSLDEVLPTDIPTLDSFDIDRATDSAWTLLHDAEARQAQCSALVRQSELYTWERTARELVGLFDTVLSQPRNRTAAIWGEGPAPSVLHEFEPQERRIAAATERQIQRLIHTGGLKRVAVPDGSRRQTTARRSANWLRRMSSNY